MALVSSSEEASRTLRETGEGGGELFVRQSLRPAELPALCSEEKQLLDYFAYLEPGPRIQSILGSFLGI
jgi:hypothetical protein